MIVKIIVLLTLCALIVFISYKISAYYKTRQTFFDNLNSFCLNLESEIQFLKTDLGQVIEKEKKRYCKDFNYILNEYQSLLKHTNNFAENFKNKLDKINVLKDDEKIKIYQFFEMLGKSNVYDQLAQIASFKQQFDKQFEVIKNDNLKFGTTSLKLGFLLSLAVFVMFI